MPRVVFLTIGVVGAEVFIKKVQLVHIPRSKLGGMDLKVSKETCGLEYRHDICGANIGLTITRLDALIDPAVSFWDG